LTVKAIIEKVRNHSNCIVHPSKGYPKIEIDHTIPYDIKEFYKICGGIELYYNSPYAMNIVSPDKFTLANPIIIGERVEEDISSNWYIIGSTSNGEYITIDLSNERLGKCHDSFWDSHGLVGECPVVAFSFTNLLKNLFENKGGRWYWLRDNFIYLGDAYDE